MLAAFLTALQFLTIMPPLLRRPCTPRELGDALVLFPVVGFLLGGALYGLDFLARLVWPAGVSAAVVLTAWVLATGALHLDGFLDTCDGLFGGRTPEDRLRIMRDERVGAYAVVGGVLLLLLKYAALMAVEDERRWPALFLATMLGRWGMVVAIAGFPYARTEGLGRAMKDRAGKIEAVAATAITYVLCGAFDPLGGLFGLVLTGGFVCLAARFVLRRLPGLTGDIYGALCEAIETLVLLAAAAKVPS